MAYVRLFRTLWHYAGRDRWKIILLVSFHVLSQISTLLHPLVFAQILNVLQTRPDHIMRHVLFWTAVWVGLFLWFNIFHRIARYFDFSVSYRIRQSFLNEYYGIATKLPLKWHSDHHSGETINRINKAADALGRFMDSQYEYISYFMLFWGPFVGLAVVSWEVSLAALIAALLAMVVIRRFDAQLAVLYMQMNELQHRVSAVFYDYIGNMRTVITLRLGKETAREVDHRIELGYAPYMKAEVWMNGGKWFTISSSVLFLEAGMILFYIWRSLSQGLPLLAGNITALYQYLQQLTNTFMSLGRHYQQVINWWIDYEAVLPLKDALPENEIDFSESAAAWQYITIENLNFGYAADKQTLREIELALAPGGRIALVGESGSGKSSLMAVLRGLYEPSSVKLDIDGQIFDSLMPLADITTLIPQEPEIFENTIRYNITFGVEHGDDEVMDAIRMACFDPVLERLPSGLDTDVRERGVTLSGGERQRLALARGILAARDSSIILMDEPTSSVDAFNEAAIYDNLFAAFADRTIVSSIHRLHLLGRFSHVIVMENGRIVQTGKFEDLKAVDGPFQTLWSKSISAAD